MALTEIRIEVPHGAADAADAVLLELGDGRWSVLEDAIARRAWIVGLFPAKAEALARWEALKPLLGIAPLGEAAARPLANRDWRNSYKAHFKAWTCGRLHWVPVWERARFRRPPGHAVLWLDPGMAFGTGNHETTRLCCRRLVALSRRPGKLRVIDAGCGSGILALSAARLGFGEITGFDIDPEAVRVSRENAVLNRMESRVKFLTADLEKGLRGRKAEVVLANIQADILMKNAALLVGAPAPGGVLVLSGILAVELAAVREVFAAAAPGWRQASKKLGEWADVLLQKPET
jgi:ribosomal protein L11 methyltransferase